MEHPHSLHWICFLELLEKLPKAEVFSTRLQQQTSSPHSNINNLLLRAHLDTLLENKKTTYQEIAAHLPPEKTHNRLTYLRMHARMRDTGNTKLQP